MHGDNSRNRRGRRPRVKRLDEQPPQQYESEIKIRRRGTPIVAYIKRVEGLFQSGYTLINLTAAGLAVDRAFAVAQEIALYYEVYLAMNTKLEHVVTEEEEYDVQISTISMSYSPITAR